MQVPGWTEADGQAHMAGYFRVAGVWAAIEPDVQNNVWDQSDIYCAAKGKVDRDPPGHVGSGWVTETNKVLI